MRSSKAIDVAPSWRRRAGHVLGIAALVFAGGMGGIPLPSDSLGIQSAQASDRVARSKPRIEPELLRTLQSGKPARYAIYFERPDLSAAYGIKDWNERGRYVYDTLTAAAERYQKPVREHMAARGYRADTTKSFWVDNILLVEEGDIALFNDLASFRGVQRVVSIPDVHLIQPERAQTLGGPLPPGPISNLTRVKAPEAWQAGARGQGLVLANIDTGVRFSHEALRDKYRGHLGGGTYDHNYNFFNPTSSSIGDADGHGTHVMGTMVGGTGTQTIGMAPDATWIACRGFPDAGDAGPFLLSCGEWVAAPTDLDGNNPDPARRPHVVNNSWGNCQQVYNGWYEGVVETWLAAGIFPAFANGNASNCGYSAPPGLNTVGNPARYRSVFSVGSTSNSTGTYATHSNWGPTDDPSPHLPTYPDHGGYPAVKPNIVAPGVAILSAVNSGDTAYQSSGWNGTSMSSPHVTGLVGLMWSAAPCLIGDFAQTGTIIQQTAVPIDYNSGGSPAPGPGNVPNYATGWGEIDAEAAVITAIGQCGPQGVIAGTVTDASDSSPLDGVQVVLLNPNPPPPSYQVSTGDDGAYSRSVSVTDAGQGYEAQFSRFGYLPQTVMDVEVDEDQTTTVNVALTPAPAVTVSGVVNDSIGGWPLYTRIDIDGYPFGAIHTDPVTGAYEVVLPEGNAYNFSFNATVDGYGSKSETVDLTVPGGDVTLDIDLDAEQATCVAPGYSLESFTSEDFEADDGGFTITGSASASWQWGTPTAWPNGCASGTSCWGTNLTGPYPNSANSTLTSPLIDLEGYTGPLAVLWRQANHIETHTYDKAFVEVSVDGGAWVVAWQNPTSTVAENWRQMRHDIASSTGVSVQFRVRFSSDSSVNYPGFYFDDVVIANPDCEAGQGGFVVGTVSDVNTNEPLTGAVVGLTGGDSAVTSTDPASGAAGFFQLWAQAGANDLSASYPLYSSNTVSISVTDAVNQRADITLGAASLSVTPTTITKNVELGQTASDTFRINNTGTADAVVNVLAGAPRQDFETAFPPAGWTVQNASSATPDCGWKRNDEWGVENLAGGEGFAAVVDSDACGQGGSTDSALTSPLMDFSGNSQVSLNFMVAWRNLGANDRLMLDVSNDGGTTWTTVHTYVASLSAQGPGEHQAFDISSHVTGSANAQFRFRYVGAWAWWAHVDQIQITADGVAWLDFTPSASVTVPAGNGVDIELEFDASAVSGVGAYSTQLSVVHETPSDVPPVSVTMNVTAPASYGEVVGTVTGLGYCGVNPSTLGGAEVTIVSSTDSYTVSTNASGQYSLFLDAAEGPVNVSVNASGHESGSATGLALTAGDQTVQDFALGELLGCTTLMPATPSFTVSLQHGESDVRTVELDNAGLAASTFDTLKRPPVVTLNLVGAPGGNSNLPASISAGLRLTGGTPFQPRETRGMVMGAGATSVLVLAPDNPSAEGAPTPAGLTALLDAMPELNATLFPFSSLSSLNVAALSDYDVVVVANNIKWESVSGVTPASVGNALADYVDAGGKVILANFAHDHTGWELGGRIITGGYSPFNTATADLNGSATLGSVLEPDHPIVEGISTLAVSGTVSTQAIGVKPTATRIANWSNGQPLVAVNADESVVALNFLVGDVSATNSFGWTGQVPELLRNAAVYLSGGGFTADWLGLDPASGSVPAGDTAQVDLVFTALTELEVGTYEAIAVIRVDDGNNNRPNFEIPVTLHITGELEPEIFSDGFED